MNKKSLMGLALAAVVTLSSTSVIAFASQNTEKSTKDVVKVVGNKVDNSKNNATTKPQNQNISKDKATEITKKSVKHQMMDTKSQGTNISDEKAVQVAKAAVKNYLGIDMDEEIKSAKLETKVSRFNDNIMVEYDPRASNRDNGSVIMSSKDGSILSVCLWHGAFPKQACQYDESKLKDAAQKFLKDKGLRTDVQSLKIDEEKKSISVAGVDCVYADGSKVLLEFNARDYSLICFSGYGKIR